jgi:hypothetical protein
MFKQQHNKYVTSGISNASPAHVGEVSNKGYEVSLRWDDKITENLSWFGGNFSNNKTIKSLRCYS